MEWGRIHRLLYQYTTIGAIHGASARGGSDGVSRGFPLSHRTSLWVCRPGLYSKEKRAAARIIGFGTLLFLGGVALNYFVIFPFAFRFLATYQVQPQVVNQIALDSYVSTFLILSLLMGILFELPLVVWALGKAGLV